MQKELLNSIKDRISLEDFECILEFLQQSEFITIRYNDDDSLEIIYSATGEVIFDNSKIL